jgi:4-amino-4-deoxy-L-arabinose transferase-like glycosyltransferase
VAAVLRFFRLGHPSLWIDEIFTWLASGGGGTLTARDLLGDVHGPLYTLAVHASSRSFGPGEWALRLPSALAGVLMVPAMAWLAARWLGRATAAPAAWFTAASPFLVRYSQEARGYSWLMLGTCASAALLLELRRRCDARTVAAWFGATAFGALSHPAFALLAPIELRWWLAGESATRRARLSWLGGVTVALALLAAPFVPSVARIWDWSRLEPARIATSGETPLRGTTTLHPAAIPFALHSFAVGYTLGPSLRELRASPGSATLRRHAGELAAVAVVFGALGALGLLALARRRVLLDGVLWLVAPALAVVYFAGHNFKVFNPRYLAVSVPAFLLVLAAAWTDRGTLGRWLLGAAVAALWGVSLHHHYFDPAYAREDYRAALAAVRAGIADGEQVLAMGAMEPVDYYGRGLPVEHLWLGYAADSTRMEQKLAEKLSRASGTWVVLSRSEDLDPAGRFTRRMERTADPVPGEFSGVQVWHIRTSSGRAEAPPESR